MGINISKPRKPVRDSSSDGATEGHYETEHLPEGGSHNDLLHLKEKCDKNNGHKGFIPYTEFSLDDLPDAYQDEDIYQFILAMGYLTVKIETRRTSCKRPDTDQNASYRGKYCRRLGTGLVEEITIIPSIGKTNYTCQECLKSGRKHDRHYLLRIPTANHLIYDSEEAEHTRITLFCNSDDKIVSDAVTIDGCKMDDFNIESDWSMLTCFCHDEDLAKLLKRARERMEKHGRQINKKYKDNTSTLAVLVSHPHGLSKQVSIGDWTRRGWVFETKQEEILEGVSERSFYTYTAATCPGSSGAAVKIFGRGFGGHGHTHSKGMRKFSLSGLGWNEQP